VQDGREITRAVGNFTRNFVLNWMNVERHFGQTFVKNTKLMTSTVTTRTIHSMVENPVIISER